jgi:chaperonin GroES
MQYLRLSKHITLDAEVAKAKNLCGRFDAADLKAIGELVWDGFNRDKMSRSKWEKRMNAAMDLALQIQQAKNFPWPGCYGLDTDVLTQDGWRPIAEVAVGELVYTRAPDGQASFEPVVSRTRHPAPNSRMVHFLGKSIDLLVTEDHQMLLQDKLGRQFFKKAGEFVDSTVTYRYIPLTSAATRASPETIYGMPVKAYLRFLGWYVSEGHAQRNFKQGGFIGFTSGSFGIAQSQEANPDKYATLRADLAATGLSYRERENGFTIHARSMPQELKNELRSLGLQEVRRIPRHVFNCAPSDLLELLDTLLLGDGHQRWRDGRNFQVRDYYTSSKGLADDVQELCQLSGLRARISLHTPAGTVGGILRGSTVTSVHDCWCVTICNKRLIQVAKLHRSFVPYTGDVACVETLPHHTLYVRRNGKAVWCGNCANVVFPLVTIAALQFSARAYSNIIQGTDVVRYRVIGDDPDGKLKDKADRISQHMSWQVLEEDTAWEEQHDRLLINLAIIGCNFIKTDYRASVAHNVSELVMAQDLVMDYYATSVESCARKTHVIPLYRNEIYERCARGTFADVRNEEWFTGVPGNTAGQQQAQQDNRRGITPPQPDEDTPFRTLEQHRNLDLDGDGYAEPYIVTIEETSKAVLRIVARWNNDEDIERTSDGEIILIKPMEYFTKYSFIAAPDGGIYDIGFGVLLGPLNESVNTGIDQLIDAGTMQNTGGGFLGRGAKIRGGVYTFAPWEWKRVDSSGDDLRKSIVPKPDVTPSPVMFQLLGLLIEYTDRIAGTTDPMVGENPGQNTPAETSRNTMEQGEKIYSTIFKRVWRSMKEEFKKLHKLNGMYLEVKQQYGEGKNFALREDYKDNADLVVPVADPNIVSRATRIMQATALRQAAMQIPGYNVPEVEKNFMRALGIEEVNRYYPGADKVPPLPNPKAALEQIKLQAKQMEFQHEQQMFILEARRDQKKITAQIALLEAQAVKAVSGAQTDQAAARIKAFDVAINSLKTMHDAYNERISTLSGLASGGESGKPADDGRGAGTGGGVSGMEASPGDEEVLPAITGKPNGAAGAVGEGAV